MRLARPRSSSSRGGWLPSPASPTTSTAMLSSHALPLPMSIIPKLMRSASVAMSPTISNRCQSLERMGRSFMLSKNPRRPPARSSRNHGWAWPLGNPGRGSGTSVRTQPLNRTRLPRYGAPSTVCITLPNPPPGGSVAGSSGVRVLATTAERSPAWAVSSLSSTV